jgi:SAM-dependent methyltransferase
MQINQLMRRIQRKLHRESKRLLLYCLGYKDVNWSRVIMNRTSREWIQQIRPERLDTLEISGYVWGSFGFKSYENVGYPTFDICSDRLDRKFDLIIAEQVFEHVLQPHLAIKNVYEMLRDDGYFFLSTPFLFPIHNTPFDVSRWSETGLQQLLLSAGFQQEKITTDSWGNRKLVRALVKNKAVHSPRYNPLLHSLENEKDFPVVVWAIARK